MMNDSASARNDNRSSYRPEHIEHVLQNGNVLVSTTVGVSMQPLLFNRRDTIIVSPVDFIRPDRMLKKMIYLCIVATRRMSCIGS